MFRFARCSSVACGLCGFLMGKHRRRNSDISEEKEFWFCAANSRSTEHAIFGFRWKYFSSIESKIKKLLRKIHFPLWFPRRCITRITIGFYAMQESATPRPRHVAFQSLLVAFKSTANTERMHFLARKSVFCPASRDQREKVQVSRIAQFNSVIILKANRFGADVMRVHPIGYYISSFTRRRLHEISPN